MARVRIKVCCIASTAEARLAVEAGADALGLVSAMPSGPGVISDATIAEIARVVPPPVATFLLTARQTAAAIAEQHAHCRTTTLQLVDRVTPATRAELRRRLPGVQLVQVVHVAGPESVTEALEAASEADALLLDSGNQALTVKELGGTGRTHDWTLSRAIVAQSPVPVFLAGGLSPANVRAAVEAVQPFGVDVCSGLRRQGALDPDKLEAFVATLA